MIRTSFDVESAHWPFCMGLMKRFRNSFSDPSRFVLMKLTMQWSVGTKCGVSIWIVSFQNEISVKPSCLHLISSLRCNNDARFVIALLFWSVTSDFVFLKYLKKMGNVFQVALFVLYTYIIQWGKYLTHQHFFIKYIFNVAFHITLDIGINSMKLYR